jgi:hypothetical protein
MSLGHGCRNLNHGLTTKARVCKGAGQKWSLKVTFHAFGSVGECEGMNPHIPKWAPTLKVGVPMDSWIFRKVFQGSKFIGLNSFFTIGKLFKQKCLKWACMAHLNTQKTSYGQKKGQESKSQFESRPLKVRNYTEIGVCRWNVAYIQKALDKGYNFASNLTSIRGLHKKLWPFKMPWVPILRLLGLPT